MTKGRDLSMFEGDKYYSTDPATVDRVRVLVNALRHEVTSLNVWSWTEGWGSDPINPDDYALCTLEELGEMLAMVKAGEAPPNPDRDDEDGKHGDDRAEPVVKVGPVVGVRETYPENKV